MVRNQRTNDSFEMDKNKISVNLFCKTARLYKIPSKFMLSWDITETLTLHSITLLFNNCFAKENEKNVIFSKL